MLRLKVGNSIPVANRAVAAAILGSTVYCATGIKGPYGYKFI